MKKLQAVLDDNDAFTFQELVQDYVDQGHGPTQIANFIGLDRRTLHKWVKQLGMPPLPSRCAKHAFPKSPMPEGCLARSVEVCSDYVLFEGQRLRVADEARRLGITAQALRYRVRNWGLDRALTEKRDPKRGGRQCES